ncbi:hypothetical protein SAMN04488132_102245 [Sediminibacterium ginsengisoli]|uniref:Uncharacterized protein n=1 Tax=Sediminibacterium ginsengisoli TaxID=413434 RepID=A0A1T4L1E5_9BACT|nr:hypothetical protein SAMN04488132_102245 [Sediminibacterium ginsengisoli]
MFRYNLLIMKLLTNKSIKNKPGLQAGLTGHIAVK